MTPRVISERIDFNLNKEEIGKMSKIDIEDLLSLVCSKVNKNTDNNNSNFWDIGNTYFIRTVTMHHVGSLVSFTDDEIILKDASWVADSGRFSQALKNGVLEEVEPFSEKVLINRKSIVDATLWNHKLPDSAK